MPLLLSRLKSTDPRFILQRLLLRQGTASYLHRIALLGPMLGDDHLKAEILRSAICKLVPLKLVEPPNSATSRTTNLVYFDIPPELGPAADLCEQLRERGVAMLSLGPQRIRAVTHFGVTIEEVEQAAKLLSETVQ